MMPNPEEKPSGQCAWHMNGTLIKQLIKFSLYDKIGWMIHRQFIRHRDRSQRRPPKAGFASGGEIDDLVLKPKHFFSVSYIVQLDSLSVSLEVISLKMLES